MKILYCNWNIFGNNDMIKCFENFGIEVVLISYESSDYDFDEVFEHKLYEDIKDGQYEFIFSFNYFPVISRVCERMNYKIKYVSWVYDSPHLQICSKTAGNSCNYIFHFDRHECEYLESRGLKKIFHLPLAANVRRLDNIVCSEDDEKLYSSDISFVGRLYDYKNLYDHINYLPEYIKGYLEGIMGAQKLVYGYYFLEELLTKPILKEIKKNVHFDLGKEYYVKDSYIFSNRFLGEKITSMERMEVLKMLSQRFNVDLYSTADPSILPEVHHKGTIDNVMGAIKVFIQTKVNLNITLRTIRTGISLRVFDIMGAGGFLITNYQQEMYELFEEGKDFVGYESLEDLKEKVSYYLKHDDERFTIAQSGYNKVRKYHTYEKRLEQMMKIVLKD